MVEIPAGSFWMGSADGEGYSDERPRHEVRIAEPFAMGVYETTFAQWDACVAAGGCRGHQPDDRDWGRGDRPAIHVSWDDAQAYVRWLSEKTGERVPSAERVGVGVRDACGDGDAVLVGGRGRQRPGELPWR